MTDRQAGLHWEGNAMAWTRLARQGWDVYRDIVNTPAFLRMLPAIDGKKGLDVGCGEGHNTRLLAEAGAQMFGVDIAPTFARLAAEAERERGGTVRYAAGTALQLPFANDAFEFATCFMSLMDCADFEMALREIYRVLQPGAFLQFSITHPCFSTPHRKLLRTMEGEAYAVEVGRYFERVDGKIERWIFSAAPAELRAELEKFEVPTFHRTLSEWLNGVMLSGFTLERIGEPMADEETARRWPEVADTRVAAYFLHVCCRKPI